MAHKRKKAPEPDTPEYPAAVMNLARAFKAGTDCAFALHDALLESGFPGPAAHFASDHPCLPGKNCLVVEDILEPRPLDPDDPTAEWPDGSGRKPIREGLLGEAEDLSGEFTEICRDLESYSVARVEVEYDGYGDSGTIESVTFLDRDGDEVQLTNLVGRQPRNRAQTRHQKLRLRLDNFAYQLLPLSWQDNAGSYGTILINTMTRRIRVDHAWRIESTDDAPYEFEL